MAGPRQLCRRHQTCRARHAGSRPGRATTRVAAGAADPSSPTLSCAQLMRALDDISVVDVRPYQDYFAAHIPTAVPLDPLKDLCTGDGDAGVGTDAGQGGWWALQLDAAAFAATVESKGISAEKPVVVYDDGSCLAAAWTWWALRVHGHPDVRVLQGGWGAWERQGGGSEQGDPCCPLKLQSYFEAEQRSDLVMAPGQLLEELVGVGQQGQAAVVVVDVSWWGSREELPGPETAATSGPGPASAGALRRLDLSSLLERSPLSGDAPPTGWQLREAGQLRAALTSAGICVLGDGGGGAQRQAQGQQLLVLASSDGGVGPCVAALALHAAGHVRLAILNGPLPPAARGPV